MTNSTRTDLPVIFRKFNDGQVIALLPTLDEGRGRFLSYMHLGQHAAADHGVVNMTKLATAEEYAPLLAELRSIYETDDYGDEPARLVVRKRIQYSR